MSSDKVIETSTTRLVKYIFLQTLQIPSVLCLIFIFYCVCRERKLRRLHNHATLLILLTCFLILVSELPITLSFLRHGSLQPHVDQLCLFWIFLNYTLFGMNTLLMAFAGIERFVLIFYSTLITRSRRRRVWFHYVPMIFCCTTVIIWYIVLVLIYPCVNTFNVTKFLCDSACYQANVVVGTIDWVASVFLPVLIVIFFNIALLIRAILQKRRLHVPLDWRRTKKMIVQLLPMVFVFLFTQIPLAIFAIIRLAFGSNFLNTFLTLWLYFTPYLIYLFTPFAYVLTTKEVFKHFTIPKMNRTARIISTAPHTVCQPRSNNRNLV